LQRKRGLGRAFSKNNSDLRFLQAEHPMMRTVSVALACATLATPMAHAQVRDSAAGKQKAAQVCNVCHGANGLSTLPNAPHLAGQPAIYFIEQMKAYRNGKRSHEVMSVIAKSVNDQDIDNLAVWYESIKVTVEIPK
jgi:cytochrome c553